MKSTCTTPYGINDFTGPMGETGYGVGTVLTSVTVCK